MRNLAGDKRADEFIQEELFLAGIDIIKEKGDGEVPYTIEGKLSNWKFERAWHYWVASTEEGKGLPLDIAIDLHEREYPLKGERQPITYGIVVRSAGFAGGIHPIDWNIGTAYRLTEELQKLGEDPKTITRKDLLALYKQGNLKGEDSIDSYHIDHQIGLNEFARVVRESQ